MFIQVTIYNVLYGPCELWHVTWFLFPIQTFEDVLKYLKITYHKLSRSQEQLLLS
jgi:hypothetical protein